MTSLPSIKLNLVEEMEDEQFRAAFFDAETSALIARQIIGLRKRLGLTQKELAERVGMQQPAIARLEDANYRGWTYQSLQRLAKAFGVARLRVLFETWDEVRHEYHESEEPDAGAGSASVLNALSPTDKNKPQEDRYGIGERRVRAPNSPDPFHSPKGPSLSALGRNQPEKPLRVPDWPN